MVMTIPEADEIVRRELGDDYCSVKLRGSWFVLRKTIENGELRTKMITPVAGGRRRIDLAINDAKALLDTCAWCGEPNGDDSTEWVNPDPEPFDGVITLVGHDGCQPADWTMA